ncbi:hypothetical protein ABZ924_37385 [Streptomyces sp. NPDC046876]|uniref:hypothetical protein n=1 Tax=Streptomyces sp. NPDC046876 TaxID=3155616 RepID=UPI0033EAE18E
MASHPGLHAVTAAAFTAAILLARWVATRPCRDPHGASAARAPWRRVQPEAHGAAADAVVIRPPDPFQDPAWQEADAHLEQCWNQLTSLYLHHDAERRIV